MFSTPIGSTIQKVPARNLHSKQALLSVLLFYYFFSFVCPTFWTYAVRKLVFATLWAFHHSRYFQLIVRTTFVFTSCRGSSKRYCHGFHLLEGIVQLENVNWFDASSLFIAIIKKLGQIGHPWINFTLSILFFLNYIPSFT